MSKFHEAVTMYPQQDSVTVQWLFSAVYFVGSFVPPVLIILTTPKESSLRFAWLPCLLYSGVKLLNAFGKLASGIALDTLVGEVLAGLVLSGNFLAIMRLDIKDLLKANVFQASDSFTVRLLRTVFLSANYRGVNTPWQGKAVVSRPDAGKEKQSRGSWLFRQALILTWQALFYDLLDSSSCGLTQDEKDALFSPTVSYSILGATSEQWMNKILITAVVMGLQIRLSLDCVYRFRGLVLVGLGIDEPEDWPPLWGSICDAYTLRGMWGKFWHQYLRWPFTTVSNHVCRDLLRLPRHTKLERYLNLFLVFLLSGALHFIADHYHHVPLNESGSMIFFPMFVIGIMIEDAVQEIWRRVAGGSASENRSEPAALIWRKVVGFAWVAAWLVITAPWWIYPIARLPDEYATNLPVSVVRHTKLPEVAVQGVVLVGGLLLKLLLACEP